MEEEKKKAAVGIYCSKETRKIIKIMSVKRGLTSQQIVDEQFAKFDENGELR